MKNERRTHAQNIAASDRQPTKATRTSTRFDQMTTELLRVLRLGWGGQWAQFEQFAAANLTKKGERIAKAIPVGCDDRKAAAEALRAGY